VFEDEVGDGGGKDGDGEVGDCEDVGEGDGEGFAVAIGAVELAHEEVGVEEEDDEGDLDERTQDVAAEARGLWGCGHGTILPRSVREGSQCGPIASQEEQLLLYRDKCRELRIL
jgi:hypothetical protein